ncbi:C25 family cysteine peptidase [Chloroflexota bacterium]
MKKMRRTNKTLTIFLLIGLIIALLPSMTNAASPPAVPATASSMEWEESFTAPGFSTQYGYDVAHVDDCDAYISTLGQPSLPFRTVSILLPPGVSSVDVSLEELVTTRVEGSYYIAPAQEPVTGDQTASPTEPDTAVYSLSINWPEEVYEVVDVTRMRQYNILVLRLYPLSYVPAECEVYLNSYIRLSVSWTPGQSGTHGLPTVLYSSTFKAMVEGIVSNPQAVKNYIFSSTSPIATSQPSEVGTMVTGDPAKYVIITPSSFVSAAQPLADWKTSKGVDARVFSLDDIVSGYTGDDNAEKMKNFIDDCYGTWGTEYVLLAGDTDYVPTRSLYCPDAYGSDGDYVPSDYYFADLSGNWDSDNDQIYGELSDNVDWGAEVFVGRLPARSSGELTTMVDKIIDYEQNPPSGDWRSRMLLCGAYSNYQGESGYTETDEAKLKEEIRTDLLPGSIDYTRLYEAGGSDPTDYTYDYALTFANVQTQLAEGYAYVNFAGHGNYYGIYRKIWNDYDHDGVPESGELSSTPFVSQGTALSNGGMLSIAYGDACNSAEIDRTTCFGEYLVKSPNGGAIGYIGATRVSWYAVGWNLGWGYNQELDYRFWQEFLSDPGNCPGEALYTSKLWYANNYNTSSYYHRKDLFTYVLIGDPEVRAPVNDAPVANDDSGNTTEDMAITIDVLANDTDPDGDDLEITAVSDPANGSATINDNGTSGDTTDDWVDYSPDADYNGFDSFTYDISDGNGGTDTATVYINVSAVNNAPDAINDGDPIAIDVPEDSVDFPINVLVNDTDPDGDDLEITAVSDPANGSAAINDNGTSGDTTDDWVDYSPDADYNGSDSFTYDISDGNGGTDTATVYIDVIEVLSFIDQTATGEISVDGSVSGDYTDTHDNDGVAESITEISTLGKPSSRISRLEHKWAFNVQPGETVTFYANAWAPNSSDGDTFEFSYSIDDANYETMFTVESASDDNIYQSFDLPDDLEGTVYVRVVDTNRDGGHRSLDTIHVDHIYIRTNTSPPVPPAAPSGLTATAASSSQIDLNWTDNADNELGFYIERLDGISWTPIGEAGPNATSYSDTGLTPDTTYWYRLQAYNSADTSEHSNSASAKTLAGNSIHVGDLDGSSSPGKKNRWDATITVIVLDDYGDPVSGATVTGDWSDGATGSSSDVTNAEGQCEITKSNIKTDVDAVKFTITGVQHDSYNYDSGNNEDPDGDSDGTTIIVLKP